MEKFIKSFILSALFLALAGTGTVWAEEAMPDLSMGGALADELSMDAEPKMAGRVESTGIYFEVKDSEWRNVSLSSSELIKLILESVPNMITMQVESAAGAVSTQITIGGLAPDTTYHKYEDNYHNHEEFTTDDSGSYTYTQDLSVLHTVFIQTHKSTKFIKDDATGGDCWSIGIWDSPTKTCTLTTDLNDAIELDSDGITLDGNGHTVTGNGTGFGVFLATAQRVTIKNLKIINFSYGITLGLYFNGYRSSYNNFIDNTIEGVNGGYGIYLYMANNNNKITGNTITHTGTGIFLNCSDNNDISGNTVNFHSVYGIELTCGLGAGSNNNNIVGNKVSNGYKGIALSQLSRNNTISSNTFSSNESHGILLYESSDSVVSNNSIFDNRYGIGLGGRSQSSTSNNVITGNTISNNNANSSKSYGLMLGYGDGNIVFNNTISGHPFGIRVIMTYNNEIYNNNFINNTRQIFYWGCYNCFFNLPKPIGGNYWSDWTMPDADGDGFVDQPYAIHDSSYDAYDAVDYFPWAKQDGWKSSSSDSTPPTTTASLSGTSGNNGWYLSDVQVTLTAADNEDGSGVAMTEYSFDGANWNTYSAPFVVNSEGTTTVYYKSTDSAGNAETANSLTVSIDKTLPMLTLSATPNILWPPNHEMVDVAIGGSATDTISHIASTEFVVMDEYGIVQPSITGFNTVIPLEPWREGTDEDGRYYTITAVVTDAAGNKTTASTTVLVPHDQGN